MIGGKGDLEKGVVYLHNGTKGADGKQKVTHGRCSDILVKDDKAWKFVAWHCTDES